MHWEELKNIDIKTVDSNRIVADYDLLIDTVELMLPGYAPRHIAVGFQGSSAFVKQPRPSPETFAAEGKLYPE